MRFRMMAVAVAVIVLQVSVASRTSEAGHRDVRRHVNTKPGVHAGYVNSHNGSVRTRGLSSLSGYGFSRSRRVHRPGQRLHRHVPVTSFSFVSSPYRYSSYGYSPHGFSSYRYSTSQHHHRPSVRISVQRPGFSFSIGRGDYGTGISLGIFRR